MKKFALGILSVFMILGGVLLSACDKKVSLSLSETEVVLYTNYENGENNQSKEIEVDVKNSKSGINVEIMHGQGCVDLDRSNTSKTKANGKYAFKILTKQDKSSGVAQLKVSSVEDSKQFQYINVTVNTIVEEIKISGEHSQDGKTNLFVVKGNDKKLVTSDYFDLLPIYANITDVDWTFENGEKQLLIDGKVCAEIDGSTLKVSEDYSLRKIDVVASYVLNKDINRKVTLEVLENSTIQNYSVDDKIFYRNGVLQTTQATVALKRNNSNLSVAQGVLVFDVDSSNDLKLKPVVYKRDSGKLVLMDNDEFENYFIFDYSERDDVTAGTKTYNFNIDAIDSSAKNMFGQFEVYFEIEYAGYNYSVSTKDAKLILDITYSATQVELTDSEGYSINNTNQDVFSSYENVFGYEVNTVIGPTDVAIDDRYFRITFDVTQEAVRNHNISLVDPVGDLATFYTSDGNAIEFTRSATGSSIFVSRALETGTKIYVKGQEIFDEIENIEFKFEARSNSSVSTSLFFTFYKIAEDKTMTVSGTEENPLEKITYLSSSVYSDRKIEYVVRIDGISTTSGLSLNSDNTNHFEYSKLTLLSKSEETEEDSFVVVSFSVNLTSYNFADVSNFWFEHITGKKSEEFAIETFVPIESLTIQNSDKSSANVYVDMSETQDYMLLNGMIDSDASKHSYSLSNIMLEAGTALPIYTSVQNASLTASGISYKFMSFDNLKQYIRVWTEITDDAEIERKANEVVANGDLSFIGNTNAFMYFLDINQVQDNYFSITNDKLIVSNRPFKGFVAVLAEGYNENHEAITIVRFFALESFYPVRYLSSNVRTTLLYTADTLSLSDIARSYIDVSISMRQDDNIPTYSNSLSYFTFSSALQEFHNVTETNTFWGNDFYSVSNVSLVNNGKNLTFRISAKSTNLQTSVKDMLRIVYKDEHGFEKSAEIQIEIKNVKRLESVQWVNRTADNEIYLNLTTTNESEKNFTISTSVEPSDANDIGLTSVYVATSGSASDIKISTSSVGQIFNVNINTTKGGRGNLYLLPNDMIKSVNGYNHILVYKYIENEDGTITEVPINIPLSDLASRYDEIISGSEEISNYFYNNDGEKVYYENIILKIAITIADGSSEGTAIRVYNQGDLEEIDYAKYYRVMNDITLSGWKAYERFSGMIYGNNGGVTLKFTNNSESFVNSLSGTLKDLTFVGDVEVTTSANAGFIANTVELTGSIENCDVDVYYINTTNSYYGSKLKTNAPQNAGMIAGLNSGTIKNVRVYGGSIESSSVFVGGLVGENNGLIENAGFEFYKFENERQNVNTINAVGTFGGLVGVAGGTSVVKKAYIYAYALPNIVAGEGDEQVSDYSTSNIITADIVRVFAGSASNGARFSESFGFIGDVSEAFSTSGTDQRVTLENCYISYGLADGSVYSDILKNVTYSFVNGQGKPDAGSANGWITMTAPDNEEDNSNLTYLSLDENIWNLEKTNTEINFGYVYLKNIAQSTAIELNDVHVEELKEEHNSTYRVLNSGKRIVDGLEYETGVLFMYNPVVQITDVQEKATLDRLNSISIASLFGISNEQAKSLLLTSESKNIMLSTDSIRIINTTVKDFEVSVHSKMDFTQVKTFRFMILSTLPTLSTMIDGISIKNNQTVLLQTSSSRTLVYSTLSSLYLSGTTQYALNIDEFTINHAFADSSDGADFVNVIRSSNSLVLSGLKKHENDNRTTISTTLSHNALSADADYANYAEVINDKIGRTFDVRVYNGAKKLEITNANNLIVRPSEYATFDVVLESDEQSDGLVFALNYDNVELEGKEMDGYVRFDVDSNLALDVSWGLLSTTPVGNAVQNRYKVLVKVSEDKKHLVDNDYSSLTLSVNALSQVSNNTYLRNISIKVETQKIEDFSISTYSIERRQIRNSILYLTPSSQMLNAMSPATDAIVSVAVTPEYAQMTHFTLTYEVSGNAVGTVGISKLAYNSLFGYYANSNSSIIITNGIRVNLTEVDKTGTGVFYFRLYISSSFASTSGLRLVVTFYNGNEVVKEGSQNLTVDYMQDAVIRVNDASTYLLSKGETAEVSVRIGLDQELYDLYLQNNESGISLSTPTVEIVGNYKIYKAQITAGVNATLVGGQDSGIFYVCASVERVLNNVQEVKTVRATLCLVDFSVDADGISVVGSGNKRVYNGKSYDVFNAYINDSSELHFNYPLLPEDYNYDKNDINAVNAIERLMEKRNQFLTNNYYKDDAVKYYINYKHDYETGKDNPITLKQQLWYATDETHSTAIYNENRNSIVQNDYFSVSEQLLMGDASRIMISGKRAGTQLMKLRTTINYQGIELVSDYYFLIVVEVWTDEESPTQITTAEEFIDYATNSEEAGDYILMNDIVLADYTPVDTSLINSLDGNGFTIHINSFKYPEGSTLKLALFDSVESNTTLRNVRVNLYNGGQISVNIKQYTNVEIAGFALSNDGVIYNCEVVSYYDEKYQVSRNNGNSGLIVKYTNGANSDPIPLTYSMGVESKVSGFVIENGASIMNSRVGGQQFKHIVQIDNTNYLKSQKLDVFYLEGQGQVSGFVNTNAGYVSACFVKNIQIDNIMEYDGSITSGFVITNNNSVQNSYVEGLGGATETVGDETKEIVWNNLTNISSLGVISGFVYENTSLVKNSYANIAIENSKTKGAMVAGFVYKNNEGAEVTLCYAACEIAKKDITQMQFSGVDDFTNSLNKGTISLSYFYNDSRTDDTIQSRVSTSALSVHDVDKKNSFYGFSFSSGEGAYDGIWQMSDSGRISLVSANQIALSNRYATTNGKVVSIFYSRSIRDVDTLSYVDLSYGSAANPIILRNAIDFAKATGKATSTEVSSYKEYYTDTEVSGRYRIVNNIEMTDIAQDAEDEGSIKLTTAKKTFRGLLDGNGFTISNISLGSSELVENFGLFARLDNAVIMNLDLTVESVHNTQANIVGVLAGTAVDSRILAIKLSPAGTSNEGQSTAVQGHNIVGGVVGMMFGESYLSDINVSNVDVSSEGFTEGKKIDANKLYIEGNEDETIKSLRNLVELLDNGIGLKSNVEKLSYAGAIAGFVDTYSNKDEGFVSFSNTLEVGDYDIVTVKVSNSVNIYAEVSGGIFGYVGKSTLIYDASISINQNTALSTQGASPSYIISKNLFAGGLIGENYGGLFAVSATYEDKLQKQIEEGENSYYSNPGDSERGQMSIFSYTPNDEGYLTRTNKPRFVGGLVGYMGGGYIYVGISKLNTISNTDAVVGGVVGLAGGIGNKYDLTFTTQRKPINTLYYEVYASGDAYSKDGVAGGIIGAVESTVNASSIIAMKNVMAMNYYSYSGMSLTADNASPEDNSNTYLSDKHFMLAGGVFSKEEDKLMPNDDKTRLLSDFYLINSVNDFALNLKDGTTAAAEIGSYTVGGYKTILMGSVEAKLEAIGFFSPAETIMKDSKYVIDSTIVQAQHIGDEDLKAMTSAYARMKNYFISNGWDEKYWTHEQNRLFPSIVLLPKVTIDFWDVDNTKDILEKMKNDASGTIVVRGRLLHDDENCLDRQDINLTPSNPDYESFKSLLTVDSFRGRLVSYESYMNTQEGGKITQTVQGGGDRDEKVGIILSQSLFESLKGNASIEGLNFYMTPQAKQGNKYGFSLISKEAETAFLRNVNIIINEDFVIKSEGETYIHYDDGKYESIGLIAGLATSTSFYNVNIKLRGDADIKFVGDLIDNKSYMGLLAGNIRQKSAQSQMSIREINIERVRLQNQSEATQISEKPINITFSPKGNVSSTESELFAGIYSGAISKSTGAAAVSVGVRQVNNINLNIEKFDDNNGGRLKKVSIGGYFGALNGADKVELVEGEDDDADGTGITINQKCNIQEISAGLAFGQTNSAFQFAFDKAINAWMIGRVIQYDAFDVERARIGSVVGESNESITITGLRVKFDVSKKAMYPTDESTPLEDAIEAFKEKAETISQNSYSYDNIIKPFAVTDNSSSNKDNAIGGVVGFARGGSSISISGSTSLSGNLFVSGSKDSNASSGYLSVGGMVGKYFGSNNISVGGNVLNNINIFANVANVNAGGIIGDFGGETAGGVSSKLEIGEVSSSTYSVQYNGQIVVSNASAINFGGAVGRLNLTQDTNVNARGIIKNYAFGGAIKVLVKDQASANVGGIVGTMGVAEKQTNVSIENSIAYGDAFMIYTNEKSNYASSIKFNNYSFGGIVGNAQKGLAVRNCKALFTNFNRGDLNSNQEPNIGAIVGGNAGLGVDGTTPLVVYEGNKYSSGVVMAFQMEAGNSDFGYGTGGFAGYTTVTGAETDASVVSNDNILTDLGTLTSNLEDGHKLKPFAISSGYSNKLDEENDISSFNGVKWVAITSDIAATNKFSDVLADNLTNMAIVGNGRIIERELKDKEAANEEDDAVYLGGITNTMGMEYEEQNTPNFNLISGMIVDLNVSHNITTSKSSGDCTNAFGGITGVANGNSFIYGVGIKGELSVGGNTQIWLGGFVGISQQCRIEQAYIDADITYRGLAVGGKVSGIANLNRYNSIIKATYSSGKIISYVNAPIYTFASAGTKTGQASMMVSDSYSITQVERKDISEATFNVNSSSSSNGNIYFIGSGVTTLQPVINGTAEVADATYVPSSDMALSYSSNYKFKGVGIKANEDYNIEPAGTEGSTTDTITIKDGVTGRNTWYFTRLTNYGYASHGFGYLKNSTTYTYDSDEDEYIPVSYSTLIADKNNSLSSQNEPWYFGIPSVGKFDQMLETVNPAETNVSYDKKYKFVLRYGFSIEKSSKVNDSKAYTVSSIGKENQDFVLDGGSNTIDFSGISMSTGFFNVVVGNIKNIRITNLNINTMSDVGALAAKVNGTIENITAIGDITLSDAAIYYAGGIVGVLEGEADRVESLVNINNSSANAIIGGVVGKLQGNVSNASNTGILQNSPINEANVVGDLKVDSIKLGNGQTINYGSEYAISAVTGGIVGYLQGGNNTSIGKVLNSYNANSVLSNFAKDKTSGKSLNVVSGGIVGYASSAKLENCYNVSLVGAGNYGNENKISYAGGIVGYATGLQAMENCVNDGPVQALGKQSSDYKVTTDFVLGEENMLETSSYNSDPTDIIMQITMIYNPGKDRLVNAYGLGYVKNVISSSSTLQTSKSTTNNIKNDGIIGEIKTASYLRLNRKDMLDGDGTNYEAIYKTEISKVTESTFADAGLKVSGLDSYGFPTRIYGEDAINRRLSDNHGYVKLLKTRTGNASYAGIDNKKIDKTSVAAWNYKQFTYGVSLDVSVDNDDNIAWEQEKSTSLYKEGGGYSILSNNIKKNNLDGRDGFGYDYNLAKVTTYYSSSILSAFWGGSQAYTYMNFDGYDSILSHINSFAYFIGKAPSSSLFEKTTVASNSSYDSTHTIKQFVDEKIANIDKAIENNGDKTLEAINVAGEDVVIAKTFNNFKTALAPNSASAGEIIFNLPEDVSADSITREDISFEGCEYVEYDIKKVENRNAIQITGANKVGNATLYFANSGSYSVKLSLSVKSNPISFKLAADNAQYSSLTKKLKVNLSAFSDEARAKLLNTSAYEIKDATVGEQKNLSASLSDSNTKITIDGVDENPNDKDLLINLIYSYETNCYGKFTIQNNRTAYRHRKIAGSSNNDFKFTYKNYREVSISKAMPSLENFTENSGTYTISYENFISALGMDKAKVFAFEVDGISFYWDGQSAMQVGGSKVNVLVSADGANIRISGSGASSFIQNASSNSATAYVIIANNEALIIGTKAGHTNPSGFGTINEAFEDVNSGIKFEYIRFVGNTQREIDNFILSDNYYGGYNGTNINFADETSRDGVEVSSPISSISGIKLKSIDVTFTYSFKATLDSSKIAEEHALELNIERDGNIIETRYFGGSLTDKNAGIIYDLNVKLGDIVELKTTKTELVNGLKQITKIVDSNEETLNILVSGFGEKENCAYSIDKGVGTIFGETMRFVTTNKSWSEDKGIISDKSLENIYAYTIWENGIIEILDRQSTIITKDEDQIEELEYENRYIFLPKEIDGHSSGYYKYEINDSNYNILQEISNPWSQTSDWYKAKDNFEKIALGFEGTKLWIIDCNSNPKELTFEVKGEYPQTNTRPESASANLLVGNESSKTISCGNINNLPIQNAEIHYNSSENGYQTVNNSSYTFNVSGEYSEVYWMGKVQLTLNKNASSGSSSNLGNVTTILLDTDIDMGIINSLSITRRIVGDNHIMRFVGGTNSAFETINSKIKDTIFAGVNSNARTLLASNVAVTLKNVQVFGSMRNIAFDKNQASNVVPTSGQTSISNNITVVGLNAETGKNVSTKIEATVNSTDKLILVAGDAIKAENAKDSYNRVDYSKILTNINTLDLNKLKGANVMIRAANTWTESNYKTKGSLNGKSGTNGGTITLIGDSTGIALAGFSSIAGFGGDGAHGRFNLNNVALGGGKAGQAGQNGESLTLRKAIKQYSGNSGIGGFGRIVKSESRDDMFILYGSANGGTLEVYGSYGQTDDAWRDGGGKGLDCIFGANINDFCNENTHGYKPGDWENFNETEKNINKLLENKNNDYSTKYGSLISGNSKNSGNRVCVSKIYTYIDLSCNFRCTRKWQEVGDNSWYKISWTSGETVNGAGGFTACSNE